MTIAIDLNDVIRDFSNNFLKHYVQNYNHEFCLDDFEFWTNDMSALFPFQSQNAYNRFVYEDFTFELFGKCPVTEKGLEAKFMEWLEKTVPNIENDGEPVKVIITSAGEYGSSIGQTLFFLSKIGCPLREYYFPMDSVTIWDRCDMLVSANPYMLSAKPEGKVSVKINTEYNKDCEADHQYERFTDFMEDIKLIEK